jgi:hypothetical protein
MPQTAKRNIPKEFGGLMHTRVKKLNPHANTPAAVKMNEINPNCENTRKIPLYIQCSNAVLQD